LDFSYRYQEENGWVKIALIGTLNEDAGVHLPGLRKKIGDNKIKFNFSKVSFVNSCGVRAWVYFLRSLHSDPERIMIFENCTSEIVNQINMIPNFKGSAKIHSVFMGYTCEKCHFHTDILFKKGLNMPLSSQEELPVVFCSKCKISMEIDELEEEYFGWLDKR